MSFFKEEIYCNAEKTIVKNGIECFESKGYVFDNPLYRSTEKMFSGSYSVKLTPETPYGMSVSLEIPKPKEEYDVSVWCFIQNDFVDTVGFGCLVASSGSQFWKGTIEFVEKREGWGKLRLKFIMPDAKYSEPLKFYCWNKTKNMAYFDDMIITRNNYWKLFKDY